MQIGGNPHRMVTRSTDGGLDEDGAVRLMRHL